MKQVDWYGCYSRGWQREIVNESFSHPAKFARGLIERIYEHALLQQGWLKLGDTILDPFGGVALGARDAEQFQWVGIELEQQFVDMGLGCDCTGINEEDWIRYYGRWKRVAYKDGRHWCPRCLAQASIILPEGNGQLSFLDPIPTAAYVRNSGRVPHTESHHYTGNIELWGSKAILIQGDSRQLAQILSEMGAVISSPPYVDSMESGPGGIDWEKAGRPDRTRKSGKRHSVINNNASTSYGSTDGQLGAMPEGRFDAVVGSPPFGKSQSGGTGFWEGLEKEHGRSFSEKVRNGAHGYRVNGDDPSNLANLPEGNIDAVIGSPPFGNSENVGLPRSRVRVSSNSNEHGGPGPDYENPTTPGQLGAMKVVSSPPYAESLSQGNDPTSYDYKQYGGGGQLAHPQQYGDTNGQLGRMRVVSSPPFSHPGEQPCASQSQAIKDYHSFTRGSGTKLDHQMETNGNLGNSASDDFWTAALIIMQQVYAILTPGSVAIWVLKGFIRDHQYVDFPNQWKQLGESVGFETIEWIRAWLIEERIERVTLFDTKDKDGNLVKAGTPVRYERARKGGIKSKVIQRKSFFRKLQEDKGSPSIDYEIVLVQRK